MRARERKSEINVDFHQFLYVCKIHDDDDDTRYHFRSFHFYLYRSNKYVIFLFLFNSKVFTQLSAKTI